MSEDGGLAGEIFDGMNARGLPRLVHPHALAAKE